MKNVNKKTNNNVFAVNSFIFKHKIHTLVAVTYKHTLSIAVECSRIFVFPIFIQFSLLYHRCFLLLILFAMFRTNKFQIHSNRKWVMSLCLVKRNMKMHIHRTHTHTYSNTKQCANVRFSMNKYLFYCFGKNRLF